MKSSGARFLIVGMGGLGCPASLALARAGARRLTVVDPDRVDVTNLHRQLWHGADDVGRLKVESAREKLVAQFPGIEVTALPVAVDAASAMALFAEHDVVIDAVDGVETKFLLSDVAVKSSVPLIYGGVLRMEGQLMHIGRGGPCLRCLFEEPPGAEAAPTCAQAGVLGSVAGVIGGLQGSLAAEVAQGRAADGALRVFDARRLQWRTLRVRRRDDCPVCAAAPREIPLGAASARGCAG